MSPQLLGTDESDDGDRYYEWQDGKKYPSVTTILKVAPRKERVIKAFKDSHPNPIQYRDRQGLVGSCVHHRILNDIAIRRLDPPSIDLDNVDGQTLGDIQTAVAMWNEHVDIDPGPTPRVEEPVRNTQDGYSGRFDLLTTDGLLCDLKISKSVYPSYKMQAAAYARSINQTTKYQDVSGAAIICLRPNIEDNPTLKPHIERLDPNELHGWYERFKRVINIWNERSA